MHFEQTGLRRVIRMEKTKRETRVLPIWGVEYITLRRSKHR